MSYGHIRIGADPEVFVVEDDKIVSGHRYVFGTKEKPQYFEGFGHIQNDGMALEFNVPPATSKQMFVENTSKIYTKLKSCLFDMNAHARVIPVPVAQFTQEYLDQVPDTAKDLGCNPDFNAWTSTFNDTPDRNMTFRTGSGHIHIGFLNDNSGPVQDQEYLMECGDIVKQLDYVVGIPSLTWDKDTTRRSLYGKAGAFRPKPYGLEYRVLSNAWLRSKTLMGVVYDRTITALKAYDNEFIFADKFGNMAEDIINNSEFNWKKNPKYSDLVDAYRALEGL